MDRGAWWATVRGVAKSQTRLGAGGAVNKQRLCISQARHTDLMGLVFWGP